MPPARTHFCAGRGACVVALFEAEENVLELVHPGVGEEQRGIVRRDERRAAHDAMAARPRKTSETVLRISLPVNFPSSAILGREGTERKGSVMLVFSWTRTNIGPTKRATFPLRRRGRREKRRKAYHTAREALRAARTQRRRREHGGTTRRRRLRAAMRARNGKIESCERER